MKKTCITIILALFAALIATSALADEGWWKDKWRREYHQATVTVIVDGLRDTPAATRNRHTLEMIRLEMQLSAVGEVGDTFYGDASTSGDPDLFASEILMGFLKTKGVEISPEAFFVGRTFHMDD
ncbi:hypothetical protein DND132_2473 [Pseudodesulfovibrio mercurii]|uniref:Uncharacterized protein n=1 Tax=Pseudodesulfovibrio mercurii TaxID=641491 RepID=F0JCJ6_9BACT|nr:hypothetical protein [Pseudodesulfovibrio mercurii]EGB15676.1 hypothetical protein DND132_2473 [Pseudodesulfovibrio mercurii]